MVNFKDIDISENWERADNYCKTKNMTLARIDNGSLFNSTQARFLHPLSIKKFWTGLKYDSKRLVWSNGRKAFCNGTLKEVVNCAGLLKLLRPRCFLMTAYQGKLEPSDCNIAHRFICQRGKMFMKKTNHACRLRLGHTSKAFPLCRSYRGEGSLF